VRKAVGRRLFPLVLLDAATGMRRGELLALEWTDLNWERPERESLQELGTNQKGTAG
jgi:integrase